MTEYVYITDDRNAENMYCHRFQWVGNRLRSEFWSTEYIMWCRDFCKSLPIIKRQIRIKRKYSAPFEQYLVEKFMEIENAWHDAQNSVDGVELRKRK